MNKNMLVWILVFFILVQSALSLSTTEMIPSTSIICGSYDDTTTITALGIINNEDVDLQDVSARLILNETALTITTEKSVVLGNIVAGGISGVNPSWSVKCAEEYPGTYTAFVSYSSGNYTDTSQGEREVTIVVTNSPPIIFTKSPEGKLNSSNIELKIETNENAICKYSTQDILFSLMQKSFSGAEKAHSAFEQLYDGNHKFYVRCADTYGHEMTSSAIIEFDVDLVSPLVTIQEPLDKVNSKDSFIKLSTDEEAICKYSLSDYAYDEMENILAGNKRTHEKIVSIPEGFITIYFACKDEAGNIAYKEKNIHVDLPPSASISVGNESRLRAGLHQIVLTTSKPLKQAPSLKYYYESSSGTKLPITMSGAGDTWIGYILIPDDGKVKVGTFLYSGVDLSGSGGGVITSGMLFIADTEKPLAPRGISTYSNNKTIKIQWNSDDDDIDYYAIYSASKPYVGYGDYYASTSKSSYIDTNLFDGDTYYYRVSAIDKAGNEGPLSEEVSQTFKVKQEKGAVVLENGTNKSVEVSSDSKEKINELLESLKPIEIDFDSSEVYFKNKKGTEASAVESLEIIEQIVNSKKELESLRSELKDLLTKTYDDETISKHLNIIRLKIKKLDANTPSELTLLEESDSEQGLTKENIELAIQYVLAKNNMINNEEMIEKYNLAASAVQEKVTVRKKVTQIEITYYDESTIKKTIIQENIFLDDSLMDDLDFIEIIPKTIAQNSNEIEFFNKHEVIENDPVIKFALKDVKENGIIYSVDSDISLETAKKAITVPLPKYEDVSSLPIPSQTSAGQENDTIKVTGYSLLPTGGLSPATLWSLFLGFFVIVILGGYYVVFIKIGVENLPLPGYQKETREYSMADILLEEDELLLRTNRILDDVEVFIRDNLRSEAAKRYMDLQKIYPSLPKDTKTKIYERSVGLHRILSGKQNRK